MMKNIYDEMRERNKRLLNDNGLKTDSAIESEEPDNRKGVGLFSFFPEDYKNEPLKELLVELHDVFPRQMVYTPRDMLHRGRLHHTFMQFLAVGDSEFEQIDTTRLIELLSPVLSSMNRFTIHYTGLIAVPTGLAMIGYPSYDINDVRSNIRNVLNQSGIFWKEPYLNNIAHSTVLRLSGDDDSKKLMAFADKYQEKDLGILHVTELSLGYGTWKMKRNEVKMVKTFQLQ